MALVVDEIDHPLECFRVSLVEEDPLGLRVAQPGAEVCAGDGHEEAVARKFLPGTKICLRMFLCRTKSLACVRLSASKLF